MPSDLVPGLTWPQRMTLDYEAWCEGNERIKRAQDDKPGAMAKRLWSRAGHR